MYSDTEFAYMTKDELIAHFESKLQKLQAEKLQALKQRHKFKEQLRNLRVKTQVTCPHCKTLITVL